MILSGEKQQNGNKLHRCSLHRISGTGIPLGAGKGTITASGLYGPAPL